MRCLTFWGSHGCDKESGHVDAGDPVHRCGTDEDLCSECIAIGDADPEGAAPNAAVRYRLFNVYADGTTDDVGWSEWMPSRWYT